MEKNLNMEERELLNDEKLEGVTGGTGNNLVLCAYYDNNGCRYSGNKDSCPLRLASQNNDCYVPNDSWLYFSGV